MRPRLFLLAAGIGILCLCIYAYTQSARFRLARHGIIVHEEANTTRIRFRTTKTTISIADVVQIQELLDDRPLSIEIVRQPVERGVIQRMGDLQHLSQLILLGAITEDDELAQLGDLKTLTSLSVAYTATEKDIQAIGNLSSLVDLDLSYTGVTEENIAFLAPKLSTLKTLGLRGVGLNQWKDLTSLSQFAQLGDLDISQTNVSDMLLRDLVLNKKLGILHLNDNPSITDNVFSVLADIHNLKEVHLEKTRVSERAANEFTKQTNVRVDLGHKKR